MASALPIYLRKLGLYLLCQAGSGIVFPTGRIERWISYESGVKFKSMNIKVFCVGVWGSKKDYVTIMWIDCFTENNRESTLCRNKLASFSIHGLPRHVAKHPKRPKTTIVVPVPMSTYGAFVEFSAMREM